MIGDDVYGDIEGALAAGMQGCLVRTGKYRKGDEGKMLNENLQVADAKKPLIAVKRDTERGNHFMFGPQEEHNYIVHKAIGGKMMLKPKGRVSYAMEVQFVNL